jgi:hypothetical protein
VVFIYIALAGLTSAALPWWIGKGDSALHLDYAQRVYHGEIPKYHDLVQYPPFHRLDPKYKNQINRAGGNPPLFYLLHAPIVGPLLDAGHWKIAIAAGRTFNIFLGILALLAAAWAGWLYAGNRKKLFSVAVPAVIGTSFQFTSLNQNYAVDVLLVLLGMLTAITWHKLLARGFKTRYTISLFTLSILGMATKATYIVFVGLSLLTVMIAAFIHIKGDPVRKFIKGALISGAILVAILICIGWFYYHWNYKTSGKWFTGELPGDFGSRPYKSLSNVLTHRDLWSNFYYNLTSSRLLSLAITLASALGVIVTAAQSKWRGLKKVTTAQIGFGLLALLLMGTTLTQITHAWGIGHFSFRYFLPAILVFSLFVSYGLLAFRQAKGQILSVALIAMAGTSLVSIAKLENIKLWVPAVTTTSNIFRKINLALTYNGIPTILLPILLGALVVGLCKVVAALFVLSKADQKTN